MMNVMAPSLSTNHTRVRTCYEAARWRRSLSRLRTFPYCVASPPARRGAKVPPTSRAKVAGLFHFSRAGWLPLLIMRASKQAIVPCIMLQMAHGFGWAALGKDQVPRFIFAARFGSVQLGHYPRFIAFDIAIIFTTGHCDWHQRQRAYSTSSETISPQNGFYVHETETRVGR